MEDSPLAGLAAEQATGWLVAASADIMYYSGGFHCSEHANYDPLHRTSSYVMTVHRSTRSTTPTLSAAHEAGHLRRRRRGEEHPTVGAHLERPAATRGDRARVRIGLGDSDAARADSSSSS